MRDSGYLKFILTLLTVVVAGAGYLTLQSLDQLRRTNLQLLDKLRELGERPAAVTSAPPPGTPAAAPAAAPELANAGFFDPAAEVGGRLIQASLADSPNLNPLTSSDAAAAEFNALCSATPAERNWENPEEYQPLLAESWEISEDHKTYRIKLRRGVKWQSFTDPVTGVKVAPRDVTAHDFKFFVDAVRNPEVNCAPRRVYYADLEELEVVDDYEYIVRWKQAFYGSIAATLGMEPMPRHFYAPDGRFDGKAFNDDHLRNRMIVGCGPYKFERWDKERRIVFRRNPDYFGNRFGVGAALEYLVYEIIKHPNTRFQALLSGSVDMLGLTPEQWTRRGDLPEFTSGRLKRYKYLLPQYTYIGYNLRNPLFADRRTRQALTMLVDREKIRRDVYDGLAEIIAGPFFALSKYADPQLKPWPYDPKQAAKLLAEAGWRDTDGDGILERDGRKFVFTMLQIAGSVTQGRMMPIIKESFAAAGIDMKIQTVEWSVYIQQLDRRSYDACSLGWTSTFDPDLYQIWHSSQTDNGGSNHIGYSNPEVDRLIVEMRRTFDLRRRIGLARNIERLLHEDQPYTFLFSPYSLTAISSRYRNVRLFPVGLQTLPAWTPKADQRALPGL